MVRFCPSANEVLNKVQVRIATEQMGNLDASQADAAGGARHEHGFAGLQPRTIDKAYQAVR